MGAEGTMILLPRDRNIAQWEPRGPQPSSRSLFVADWRLRCAFTNCQNTYQYVAVLVACRPRQADADVVIG